MFSHGDYQFFFFFDKSLAEIQFAIGFVGFSNCGRLNEWPERGTLSRLNHIKNPFTTQSKAITMHKLHKVNRLHQVDGEITKISNTDTALSLQANHVERKRRKTLLNRRS